LIVIIEEIEAYVRTLALDNGLGNSVELLDPDVWQV
jgi:hypothetical protein